MTGIVSLQFELSRLKRIKLSGDGSLPVFGCTIFYKVRPENISRVSGIGFTVKSKLMYDMSELPPCASDRHITRRFQLISDCFTTMINVYTPTPASSEADIEIFYSDLRVYKKKKKG